MPVQTIHMGYATNMGIRGAEWWLKKFGELPDYYVDYNEAKDEGWRPYLGNLSKVLPNKLIAKGIYHNRNKLLPEDYRRTWYEADINYTSGFRGSSRIIFSNDGLVFVTYDHYNTFYEIVEEE